MSRTEISQPSPDPVVAEYMGDLFKAVVDHGAEVGIGLDGDATASGLLTSMATLFPETGLWPSMPGKCLNANPVKP